MTHLRKHYYYDVDKREHVFVINIPEDIVYSKIRGNDLSRPMALADMLRATLTNIITEHCGQLIAYYKSYIVGVK